jgi:hypothetical protein
MSATHQTPDVFTAATAVVKEIIQAAKIYYIEPYGFGEAADALLRSLAQSAGVDPDVALANYQRWTIKQHPELAECEGCYNTFAAGCVCEDYDEE